MTIPVNALVTPHVGGGQAGATQLGYGFTPVAPPASSGDSIALPAAVAGSIVVLFSYGDAGLTGNTNNIAVFAKNGTTDKINGSGSSAAQYDWEPYAPAVYRQNQGAVAICVVDGVWITNLNGD